MEFSKTQELGKWLKLGIKKGTKLTDTPKNILYQIRVDAETNRKAMAVCEKEGISKSELIRQGIDLKYNLVCKRQ